MTEREPGCSTQPGSRIPKDAIPSAREESNTSKLLDPHCSVKGGVKMGKHAKPGKPDSKPSQGGGKHEKGK